MKKQKYETESAAQKGSNLYGKEDVEKAIEFLNTREGLLFLKNEANKNKKIKHRY